MNSAVVSSKVAHHNTRSSQAAGANASSSSSDQSFDGLLSHLTEEDGAAGKSHWAGSKKTQATVSTDSTAKTTDTTQGALNASATTTGTLPPELLAILGAQAGATAVTAKASDPATSLLAAAASLAQDKAALSDDTSPKTANALIAGLSIDHHLAPSTAPAKANSVTKDVAIKNDADSDPSSTEEGGSSTAASPLSRTDSATSTDAKAKSATDEATLGEVKTDTTSDAPHGSLQDSIQAIAHAVSQMADAETADQTSTAATASVDTPTTNVSLAPARTMTLQLTPADLGTVSVRMHLAGGGLDVQLSVSDQQTLGLLSRAHDSLSNAMNSDTYQLQSLVIQGTDAPGAASGGQNASQNNTGGDARSNQNQTSAGSGGRQDEGPPSQRQESRATQDSMAGTSSSSRASSNQLFI